MQQYSKYIMLKIMSFMVIIIICLTGVAILVKSLKYLEYIVEQGVGIGTFLYLMSLFIPTLLWVIVPVAFFISVMLVYNKLTVDSEFMILKSAGLNNFSLAKPAIYFGIIVTLFSYLISFYLLPTSFREFKDMQSFIRDNYASILLQEGVFSTPAKGLTVYIREKDTKGNLQGIIVHDSRNSKNVVTYMAEQGKLRQTPTGPRAYLINGNQQEIDVKTGTVRLLYFERYSLDLKIFNADINNNRWREPQERYISELFYPIDTEKQHLKDKLYAEGHYRIVWPIINLILCLIALTPFMVGDYNRRGKVRIIFISIFFALVVFGSIISFNFNISKNTSLVSFLYATIVLYIILAAYFSLSHKGWFKFSLKPKIA